jgi:hypothetical protein
MAFDDTISKPSMTIGKRTIYSIIGGFLITLVTSIIPNNTLIGASNSGYPFPWLSQPLYPIGSLPTIIWEALLIDVVVWGLVAFVLIVTYQFLKSR